MDLTAGFARALDQRRFAAWPDVPSLHASGGLPPVFQLTSLPQPIDMSQYADAMSPANPTGSELPLAAFQALVDPVPTFSRYYAPSGASSEGLWTDFLAGAQATPGNAFAASTLAAARHTFATSGLPDLLPVPGTWHPVYPVSPNWTDTADPAWTRVTVDPSDPGGLGGAYLTIGAPARDTPLRWLTQGDPSGQPLSPDTKLTSISFTARSVGFMRPWIDTALLKMAGIVLPGQDAGLLSSGHIAQNGGVLPLLTTGFILARDIQIEGAWAPADLQRLQTAQEKNSSLALANLMLTTGKRSRVVELSLSGSAVTSPVVQIIAWISALVPLLPNTSGIDP